MPIGRVPELPPLLGKHSHDFSVKFAGGGAAPASEHDQGEANEGITGVDCHNDDGENDNDESLQITDITVMTITMITEEKITMTMIILMIMPKMMRMGRKIMRIRIREGGP